MGVAGMNGMSEEAWRVYDQIVREDRALAELILRIQGRVDAARLENVDGYDEWGLPTGEKNGEEGHGEAG